MLSKHFPSNSKQSVSGILPDPYQNYVLVRTKCTRKTLQYILVTRLNSRVCAIENVQSHYFVTSFNSHNYDGNLRYFSWYNVIYRELSVSDPTPCSPQIANHLPLQKKWKIHWKAFSNPLTRFMSHLLPILDQQELTMTASRRPTLLIFCWPATHRSPWPLRPWPHLTLASWKLRK